jgi:hypothetical protein
VDSGESNTSGRPRAGARPWPIAGAFALTALAGVLMTTPYLARAEPAGQRDEPVPDAGATDEATENGAAEPSTRAIPGVNGYVDLLPDVAIRCRAEPGRTDRAGRGRNPRLFCAEVRPRVPHRRRPLDGFWG